jgi:hypothetical protein
MLIYWPYSPKKNQADLRLDNKYRLQAKYLSQYPAIILSLVNNANDKSSFLFTTVSAPNGEQLVCEFEDGVVTLRGISI